MYCWLILTVHSLLSLENIITNFPGFTLALVPGYYANQLLDIWYLYLPLREIGVTWANHESACHSSRAARRPRLSLLRQNPNSSSLLIRLQDGAEVVRLPVGSLTKPQEDEVGGVRSGNIPDFYPPPLLGCRSHPSKPPISVRLFGKMDQNRSKQMGSEKNPFGGVQPPLLQSASSHFSRLSGLLPESGEEEGPSRAVKEMEMKGAIEVVRTPSPGFYSRLF